MEVSEAEKHSDGSSNDPTAAPGALPLLGRGAAGHPAPASEPLPPIAALLEQLKQLKRVYLEPSEADVVLTPLVAAALAQHPQLKADIARFGWGTLQEGAAAAQQGQQWRQAVDLHGLASCLKKAKWMKLQQVGSGSYGVVFKARDIETGESVAIKKLAAKYEDDCSLPEPTVREITTLKELRNHPNVVRCGRDGRAGRARWTGEPESWGARVGPNSSIDGLLARS